MIRVLMIGQVNSITQNIYRSLLRCFQMQYCPPDEKILPDMIRILQPEVTLISLIGMQKEQKSVITFLTEKHSAIPLICVGNEKEFRLFEDELKGKQYVRMIRPVTIREITEKIYSLLNVKVRSGLISDGEKKRKRILLIDDSAVQLRVMKGMLQNDYDIDMAKSGKEAMMLIQKNIPDMIFLDYDMPGCDGRMTFELLKNEAISSDIPVVFLTGVDEREKVLSVLAMCPADYLLKPVNVDKIMETIKNVIGE